ncbi:MAG: hypothetical protein ACRDV9_09490 [Acidimicrobiia bacterium]
MVDTPPRLDSEALRAVVDLADLVGTELEGGILPEFVTPVVPEAGGRTEEKLLSSVHD